MALTTTTSSVAYTGNASTSTNYPVPFTFFSASDLTVYVTDSSGNITTLTLGTDYAVTGGGFNSTGNVTTTTAWDNTHTVTIARNVTYTQTTSLSTGDEFPSVSMEQALDQVVMQTQQLSRTIKKSLRGADATADFSPIPSSPSTGTWVLGLLNGTLNWITQATASIGAGSVVPSNISSSGAFPWVFNGGITGNLTGSVTGNASSATSVSGSLTGTANAQSIVNAIIFG